ncbi:MAG: glycolate oxidase subunit GlcF [Motiliproteus sp.]|nr:glycolate oxidase subunit GlcF [Motiliproteus sp.]MCW9052363.1 glycolate oxidase subunit GlcF [Motiliproteus sp.]
MQTNIDQRYQKTSEGQEADAILRSCVHCGFCTATCPTYQELGDERDGPRGRIYLIKQFLEGGEVTENTRLHLDRCLGCRSCETTCPSGVKYGRLLDIGRGLMEQQMPRPLVMRIKRWLLRMVLPYRSRFSMLLRTGQLVRPLLPQSLRAKIPENHPQSLWPKNSHPRVMLALAGCVQSATSPNTNAATARVLDRLGITLVEVPEAGCCGAVSYHLGAHQEGLAFMRRNIDAWWPAIEAGAEAIVMTASGCGGTVQEYGDLLRDDPAYSEKARRVSELAVDLGAVLLKEDLSKLTPASRTGKVAVHCPCSQQHALKQGGVVEQVLQCVGIDLARTTDQHLCCGSAGTYSLLQPELSQKLLENKLQALNGDNPDQIVTANIGCQLHLASQSKIPVQHWIELLDQ